MKLLIVLVPMLWASVTCAATLRVVAHPSALALGATVEVEIDVRDVTPAAAPAVGVYDLRLNFDASVLEFASVNWGSGLDVLGLGSLQTVTNSPGMVGLFELSFDTIDDLNSLQPAQFRLATVFLTGTSMGSSPLSLTITSLGDAEGNPLGATIENSAVSVGQVPEPGTFVVSVPLAVAFGFALLRRRRTSSPRKLLG